MSYRPVRSALAAQVAAAGLDWIVPDWPAPSRVCALSTTRSGRGGAAFDLARHHPQFEAAKSELRHWLPADPVWLAQVHGAAICDADAARTRGRAEAPVADGAVARLAGTVCAVQCADCLPVLLCDRDGSVVAAAHAGWRGLAAGVLEAALAAMGASPAEVRAWLGPAIGPQAFEVGADVLAAHCSDDPDAQDCFTPHRSGKWLADLYALARRRLRRAGVTAIHGGDRCTATEAGTFHSYRRDGVAASGRMATLIWIAGH
jgi:purine-nucleoside/S-methyl-5'-thioadenosine phosphorylase / adenosine deaminase